eukprot:scaffold673018_cov61-Prasinocladus_malaysianus.AAC.1
MVELCEKDNVGDFRTEAKASPVSVVPPEIITAPPGARKYPSQATLSTQGSLFDINTEMPTCKFSFRQRNLKGE